MIKIKSKQNGKEINVEFYNKKELLGSVTKYENKCMVCKKVSVDDAELGDKYICGECLEILKKSIKIEKPLKKVKKVDNKQNESNCRYYLLENAKGKYTPSIKIANWIDYKNLLTLKISEKVATMFIELIIKGINTASKIAKAFGTNKIETIYAYLSAMNRVAMIYTNDGKKTSREKRIYKISQHLIYTAI